MSFFAAAAGVLLGILATAGVGLSVARLFAPDLTRAELAAWSLATGLLLQSLLLAIIVAIFRGPLRGPLLALDALVVAASFLARRAPVSTLETPTKTRAAIVLLAVAGAAWAVFLIGATAEPMWSTDYLAIWGLKGKTIFETGSLPGRLFDDPALFWAHREYPLLVPLSLAALGVVAGSWNDQALALLFPLCELATLAAIYGFLARRVSPLAGAAGAALASLDFFLYRAVNAGTAEVPFALSLVLVSCAFLDALSSRSRAVVARLLVASLFCASIKQEGTLFASMLAVGLLLRRRRVAWALALPPALHWSLLYVLRGAQTRRDFDFTLFEPRRWSELSASFLTVLGRILGTDAIVAWLPLTAIALFLILTRRGIADALLPVLVLQVFFYAIAFSVSSFDPIYAIEGAFRRIATTLFPALTLVLAARIRGPA